MKFTAEQIKLLERLLEERIDYLTLNFKGLEDSIRLAEKTLKEIKDFYR